jgi:tRNA (guanosine-2'-O-)-methyltransferase
VAYDEYEYPEMFCLVLGNVYNGVTKATLAACDAAVFIPMYGKGRSLNVAMSLGVVAFQVVGGGG